MENPWAALPTSAPFVAATDAPIFARHPAAARDLRLDFLPSPYMGTPDARVFVLLLNPGARNDDFKYGPEFVQERRRALRFESEHPFWCLNPRFAHMEGYQYVSTRLGALIEQVGTDCVADGVMWLQFFGYQSLVWRPFPVALPSQRFAFELLRAAMSQAKPVIIARSRKLWESAIPELSTYDYIELRNPRSPYLTRRNMGAPAFDRVLDALTR